MSRLWATTASPNSGVVIKLTSGAIANSLFFCFKTACREKKELVIVCHWPLQTPRLIGAAAPQQALVSLVIQEVVYCQVENQCFNSPVFSRSS